MAAMKVIRRNLMITVAVLMTMIFASSFVVNNREAAVSAAVQVQYEQETDSEMNLGFVTMDAFELNIG